MKPRGTPSHRAGSAFGTRHGPSVIPEFQTSSLVFDRDGPAAIGVATFFRNRWTAQGNDDAGRQPRRNDSFAQEVEAVTLPINESAP